MQLVLRLAVKTSLAFYLVVSTSACTSYELEMRTAAPMGVVPPGAARICVLRPHNVASLVPAIVHDNGRLVGMTKGPSYFCYLAEPGYHSIVSRYGDDVDERLGTDELEEVTVLVPPNARLFLHHDVSKIMSMSVQWVDPTEANTMIGQCNYVELVAVPKGESLPAPNEVLPARRPR
jgi:hypothetical protein